jgi:hypothetical protein
LSALVMWSACMALLIVSLTASMMAGYGVIASYGSIQETQLMQR